MTVSQIEVPVPDEIVIQSFKEEKAWYFEVTFQPWKQFFRHVVWWQAPGEVEIQRPLPEDLEQIRYGHKMARALEALPDDTGPVRLYPSRFIWNSYVRVPVLSFVPQVTNDEFVLVPCEHWFKSPIFEGRRVPINSFRYAIWKFVLLKVGGPKRVDRGLKIFNQETQKYHTAEVAKWPQSAALNEFLKLQNFWRETYNWLQIIHEDDAFSRNSQIHADALGS